MNAVYVAIGSNYQPKANITHGLALLRAHYAPLRISPFYLSTAIGQGGADYYNAVIAFHTEDDPTTIKSNLSAIEDACERIRHNPDGTKSKIVTLDCDILLYGDAILTYGERIIPHPDILRFAFVAIPLADINPDGIHPQTCESFASIAKGFDSSSLNALPDDFNP